MPHLIQWIGTPGLQWGCSWNAKLRNQPKLCNLLRMCFEEKRSRSIRGNYDRIAAEYARRLADELQHKPLDRELLDRLAASTAGRGAVCDVGCGPGHVARYLRDAGADIFGLDLSPGMLEQARALHPEMRFVEGNLLALPLEDNSLAGIAAFYAIVNLPEPALPQVFAEMRRVLQTDGVLLLAFHVGDEARHVTEMWGCPTDLDFFFFAPAMIRRLLESAGLRVEETIARDPYPDVEHPSRRAYIWARK
jgi:SAM-dependent methyltransferase